MLVVLVVLALLLAQQDPLIDARKLLEANRIEEALEPLRSALAASPDAPEALWMIALAYLRLGRYDEGLPFAESMYRAASGRTRAGLLLAEYREALRKEGEAIAIYRSILLREPRNPEVLRRLGRVSLRSSDLETAAKSFETILSDYPGDPQALAPLGAVYARMGKFSEAIASLTLALEKEEDSAEAHHYLGAAYSELGLWDESKRHLERALALQPHQPATLFEMGLLYARLEDGAKALELFREAAEASPENPQVHFRIAEIQRFQKSFAEAEREYRMAFELQPDLVEARFQLGLLLLEATRYDEAKEVFQGMVEKDPANAEAHHQLAQVDVKLGRGEEARVHFEKALSLDAFAYELYLHFGNFLMQQGEPERGREVLLRFQELKRADDRTKALAAQVELEPENLEAKKELLAELLALGKGEDALREAQRFLAQDPSHPDYQVLLAEVRQRAGTAR
jgi:tetratricopeptide (TPR) repeat protein